MVQKILMLLVGLFMFNGLIKAEDSKQIQFEELPAQAQKFVKINFEGTSISYIMQDEEGLFGKEYDVIFTNGNKVEFDRKGMWKQIEFKTGELPMTMLPYEIRSFLQQKYPGKGVKEMERDSKEYEIKLSDGTELHFNKKFELTKLGD